ncbi:MAG: 23S rRNA (guanosine(2251)-2'-O)-methyltransferase RlmB [Anaerolineales bacterium]|nr:23S rRNA (guanosine(2251)-2'-O)-methyltransferase RlmB [Anaerolineales bacterium]
MKEWITGRNPVYEVLRANRRQAFQLLIAEGAQVKGRLDEILQTAKKRNIPIRKSSRRQLDTITANHQGIGLQTSGYPYCTIHDILDVATNSAEPPLLLILDALQDPQNMGTLLRSAEAVGVHGILIPFRRTATVTPAVVNASSGASEHLLIAQANLAQAISQLKAKGIWVIGLENTVDAKLPDQIGLEQPLALVVGSEGQGLRKLVREACDLIMNLPMRGKIGSLNAAVAGSTALYFAWKARGFRR